MELIEKFKKIRTEKKAKKNSKEPERNPYFMCDYCILKDKIFHQDIGGKKAYFDRRVSPEDIVRKATYENNIACKQFIERRPDLFGIDPASAFQSVKSVIKNKAIGKKYHYVKIWNTNPAIYPEYTYLGYVICSDEIKKTYKVKQND